MHFFYFLGGLYECRCFGGKLMFILPRCFGIVLCACQLTCLFVSRSTMHGANGQDLSPEDVVKAGALDSPSALDFSGDTYSCMC